MDSSNSLLIAIALLVLKEIVSGIAGYFRNKNVKDEQTMLAINTLQIKVGHMDEKLDDILRIKNDVDVLHGKMRVIELKMPQPPTQQ